MLVVVGVQPYFVDFGYRRMYVGGECGYGMEQCTCVSP